MTATYISDHVAFCARSNHTEQLHNKTFIDLGVKVSNVSVEETKNKYWYSFQLLDR